MIDDISTVLSPSYHVAQSLVILEEIIRVALVRVVLFLGGSQARINKNFPQSLTYLVQSPTAGAAAVEAVTPEIFRGRRLADFAPHRHHLHRQEVLRPHLPAGLDQQGQVVGVPQVALREPQLLAGRLLPVQAGGPGPEGEVGVVAGRDPGVLHPALPPGRPVVLGVAGRGAHTRGPGVPAGSPGGGGGGGGGGSPADSPATGSTRSTRRRQRRSGRHHFHLSGD